MRKEELRDRWRNWGDRDCVGDRARHAESQLCGDDEDCRGSREDDSSACDREVHQSDEFARDMIQQGSWLRPARQTRAVSPA